MMETSSRHINELNHTSVLISIITVTYNAAQTIGATIDSVAAQDYDNFEHLIIDGASTDNTIEIARKAPYPRINIISEPDHGLYDAMNKGLARARGRYVVFLNAGDRFHASDTLSHIAAAIHTHNFPGVVYGQTDIVDTKGHRVASRHLQAPDNLTFNSFADGMVVCHQAFVARKDLTSPFDLTFRFSADYDWCIRVLERSRQNIPLHEVIIDYLAEGVTTNNRRASLLERFRIMSRYYGLIPTIWRHLGFIPRFIRRRKIEKKFINTPDR